MNTLAVTDAPAPPLGRVAVVGSGRMGEALTRLLAPQNPGLIWSSRDPLRLATRLNDLNLMQVSPADHADAVALADVLVLALWHRHALDFVRLHADALEGKVLVDIANPFTDDFASFTLPETTSAAEQLAAAVPASKVVGALKNIFWVLLEDPSLTECAPDVLVTGDDLLAKAATMALLEPLPFRVLDAGPLANSRTVERMTLLSREVAIRYGHYPSTAWRLLGQRSSQPAS